MNAHYDRTLRNNRAIDSQQWREKIAESSEKNHVRKREPTRQQENEKLCVMPLPCYACFRRFPAQL